MLGCEENVFYLYDRGGTRRLLQLDGAVESAWERAKNDISSAFIQVAVASCTASEEALGDIRALRHELVVYRGSERVWEGPVTRVQYEPDFVTIHAKDVLFWVARRAQRGRFATGNVVTEAATAIADALYYDDPNVGPYVVAQTTGAPEFTSAFNASEGYYYDALQDMVEEGLNFTTVGRSIVLWPSNKQVGQTALLRSPDDLKATVTVFEDGVSLATRVVAVGGDTYGATTPNPSITNLANNPSLETNSTGFRAPHYFDLARLPGTWGSGNWFGRITANTPAKPAVVPARPSRPRLGLRGGDSDAVWQARKDAYHAAVDIYEDGLDAYAASKKSLDRSRQVWNQQISDYNASEIVMDMWPQRLSCHPGELISATLQVRGVGAHPTALGLRLRGVVDGVVDADRAFEEGPPVWVGIGTERQLFVSGTVPEKSNYTTCFVEVYRDTRRKWTVTTDGFEFDQFAEWRGRIETWFDGNTPDADGYVYQWTGSPNNSQSRRRWRNEVLGQFRDAVDPYYGIVESIEDSSATTRVRLEQTAKSVKGRSDPPPLAVDVPANAPLLPVAPVEIKELVAGTTVPIQTTTTARRVRAATSLDLLQVKQDRKGESVLVTLISDQVWETTDTIPGGEDG